MNAPKVFISYSHDSDPHKLWVLNLARKLRTKGIEALIDRWEISPGDDIPLFMERSLSTSDRVIAVCSAIYVQKANSGVGGVGYEKMILTAELIKNIDSNKVIPIIWQNKTKEMPYFLSTKYFIDFSQEEKFEGNFDILLRTIYRSPADPKPDLGVNPYLNNQQFKNIKPENINEDLCQASANGNIKKIKQLISLGANINYHRIFDGATPLHLAIVNEHLKAVIVLTKHGASISEKDNDGITPFDEAVNSENQLIKLAIGRTFSTKAKCMLMGRTEYYSSSRCPYCLTESIEYDSGSDAAGTVWWSYRCSHCNRGHGEAH